MRKMVFDMFGLTKIVLKYFKQLKPKSDCYLLLKNIFLHHFSIQTTTLGEKEVDI